MHASELQTPANAIAAYPWLSNPSAPDHAGAITYGFDIYHGDDDNGPVQFNAAYTAKPSRKFVFIKAVQGYNMDPHYRDHMTRARAIGSYSDFLSSPYGFAVNNLPAVMQVNKMFVVAGGDLTPGSLLPMWDCEINPEDGSKPSGELVLELCALTKQRIGKNPILYFGAADYADYYSKFFPNEQWADNLCLARYAGEDPSSDPVILSPESRCAFHQYTGSGRFPQPNANSPKQNFDFDVFLGDFALLKSRYTI